METSTQNYLDYLKDLGYHVYFNRNESDAFCFSDKVSDLHFIKVDMRKDYQEVSLEDEYNNSEKIYIINETTKTYTNLGYNNKISYKIIMKDNEVRVIAGLQGYARRLRFTLKLKTCNVKSARTAL